MTEVPALVSPVLATTVPATETNGTLGPTLPWTQRALQIRHGSFYVKSLDNFQISHLPSKDKDLLAGTVFQRICQRQFQKRGVVKSF